MYPFRLSVDSASACELWQVQDVVAHLIEVDGLYTHSVARGLTGDAEPPEGRLPAGAVNASIVAASVAQRSIATRQRLGGDLLDPFQQTGDRLNDVMVFVWGLAGEGLLTSQLSE